MEKTNTTSNSPFEVTCAIPRSGRTFENFLEKLKAFGVNSTEIDKILAISKKSKAFSTIHYPQALQTLQEANEQIPCFGLFIDRKREHRPYRIGFLGYDWLINDVKTRIEGEEPHNGSALIKLDEIDCAVVGLDELLTMTQYHLYNPTLVTKWGMYNYNLDPRKPSTLRIAGSAKLTRYNSLLKKEIQDIVGFFLISKPKSVNYTAEKQKSTYPTDFLSHLAEHGRRIFVKGRYASVVNTAYPNLKVTPVENVEDAVLQAEAGSVGLEIVQTGNTLKQKGLILHSAPLFISESVYVVDYRRYLVSKPLRQFIKSLKPIGYFEEERIKHFALWYRALEKNLGDAWVHRPPITALYCTAQETEHGLRPYRLRTRYWRPDDIYKQEEAFALVDTATQKLLTHYQILLNEDNDIIVS